MATLQFDATLFRQQFPGQFLDPPNTDAILELYWNTAICYVSPDTGEFMTADCRRQIINLVVGHLITIAGNATIGQQSGFIESASIDKVSVTIQSFDNKNQFQWFLNQTPYGQQAYAQLHVASVGGFYFGGRNELGSFRRSGGDFSPTARVTSPADDIVCALLVIPPVDTGVALGAFGSITPLAALLPAGCSAYVASFTDATGPSAFSILLVDSNPDTGQRYNVYFWDSDARAGVNAATQTATNISIAGAGFLMSGLTTGSAANDPNLISITGFESNAVPLSPLLTIS